MRKVAIFVALLLAGCNETSLPNITVPEFLDNPSLLSDYKKKCTNDPGGIGKHPTCINALEADMKSQIRAARQRLKM